MEQGKIKSLLMSLQFQVPQFIEVEDKIFGPFTVKQFIYIAGSAGVVFVIFSIAPFWLTLILGTPIMVAGVGFAFFKVNNRPFIFLLESWFSYLTGSKLYIWKKRPQVVQKKGIESDEDDADLFVPRLSDSKLKDLAWSLDIQENIGKHNELIHNLHNV